ncbi:MAG: hypothetical protein K2X93_11980 [Candidatus Obscuribacterales bacterium]|nr:hypothetical protein [Candidatus Obscuribacterales bacterium]
MAKSSNASFPQLAEIYLALGETGPWPANKSDTIAFYTTIIDLYESKHQPVDRFLTDAHFGFAKELKRLKNSTNAWKEFAKTVELSENAKGMSNNERSWYLQCFADYEQSTGKYKEADEHFKQFIGASKGCESTKAYQHGLFRYLRNFLLQGRGAEGAPVFSAALNAWSREYKSDEQQARDLPGLTYLGDCANDIGYAFIAEGKHNESAKNV